MRRLSRLLRRVPRDAPDGPAQEELETPPPAAVSCVSPCATDVDQFSAEHNGDGMDRADDAWDQQAPEAAQAGKASATARSAAADGMGSAAVAHVAEAAPGAAATTESAPDAKRAAVERVVPALKAAPASSAGEVEYGQRVPGAFAAGNDAPAPSAAVGLGADSAFAEADPACVSLAHVSSQSDPESTGPQSSQSVAGAASPEHAGHFDSAQSHTQPPVLLPPIPGSSSGAPSSIQSDTQSTVQPGSSSLAPARRAEATSSPAQSDAQPSVVLPATASAGSGASSPTSTNTGSISPGSTLLASTSSSRGPTDPNPTTQPDTQSTLPHVLPSTSASTPSANPNPTTSTSARTNLDPHVAIPLTPAPTSAPTSSDPDPAQPEPPVIPPPDPRIPRTLPLGTTMIVQGLVQTIEVNRPPVSTNQAQRTNEGTNERTNDEAINDEASNERGERTNEQGDAINERDETINERVEQTNEEEPLLSADKGEEDKHDDKGESSSGQGSGQSSSQAITTPHRSTTPPPPPNFTAIPTRPGVPPPSSTDVLGLLLSIAAQATAEALVPWSVPPRSRAPASWTGAPGREGIASGLAAAFSALASAGTGGPPPTEPITVPAPPPPPPAPEPAPVTAPTSPSPRRRESASSPVRRFASRRLSALVPGRAGSRQSSVQDAEGNDASATATINESSATATINESSATATIHEASAVNEAGSSSATTMSTPFASTSTSANTTNANSAANTPGTSMGSNLASTSTGSNLASTSSAAPKPERRRGVLGTLRRLVPWRSGSSSRPWRRRASAPQVETLVRAAQVHASTPAVESNLDETPLESQADPAPIVVSQADEPIPAPEVEEADFGRAPPTPVSPTPLPESSVSPSPTLAVPPSTIPIPPPPPPPPSPPTTDAEDLVRFSRMLGFTPGAVHPSGSFERFLADMQDELRAALGEYQERVRGRVRDERVEATVPVPADPATSVESSTPVADSSMPAAESTPTPVDTSRLLDHTRPHIPSTDPLPLNWWRMYRFPALPGVQVPPNTNAGMIVTGVSSSSSSTSPPSSETSTESPESTSPPSSDASVESLPSSGASTATPDSGETATVTPESTPSPEPVESPTPDENATQPVHPAIIIGLRSVTRDLDEPPSAPVPAPGNETTDDSGSGRDQSSDAGRGRTRRGSLAHRFGLGRESGRREEPVEGERETEERRSREGTRNYIIWIIGGYYPSGHPLLAHPNLFLGQVHPDELWMLNEFLGQVKPPTASREEIAKAGLRVVKGTEVQELASSGSVTENCTERCLICLDNYADEEDLRIMNCKHMFHKDCVDRWMETGRNNCPACRTKGVDTTPTPAATA